MSPRLWITLTTLLLLPGAMATAPSFAAPRASAAPPVAARLHRLVVHDGAVGARRHAPRHADSPEPDRATRSRHASERPHTARGDDRRSLLRLLTRQQDAQRREQAQIDARAAHIYALSQTNAPILDDTRACKRIGAHGESIYQNCSLATEAIH